MNRSTRRPAMTIAVAVSILMAAAAFGQTTGQIEGTVFDQANAALPGVTVEVTSPALQGPRVEVTEANGSFRFVFLPPGSYTVRCSLSGFVTVEHDGIVVPLGRTVTLQVQIQPAFHDEVTVSGAPPAIDVRSSEVGANVDRDFFLSLPFERDFISIVQATPGTTTDGSGTVVYGSTGLENAYYIDGINTSDVVYRSQGRVLNFEFIGEVQVRTGGYAAEYGGSTGGVINVITRSGGNEFHGDVFGYYFSDALQSQPREGVETYHQEYITQYRSEYGGSYIVDAFRKADVGFDLGGYLLKDRLWFFAAYDWVAHDEDRKAPEDYSAYGGPAEGTIYVAEQTRQLWSTKLTWRAAANHSLILSAFGDPARLEGPVKSLSGEESTFLGYSEEGGDTWMLRWEGALGSRVVVEAQASRYRWAGGLGGAATAVPEVIDYTTPLYAATGVPSRSGGLGSYWDEEDVRDAGRLDATVFVGDLAGDHEFKGGAEVERLKIINKSYFSGAQIVQVWCARGYLTSAGCPAEWVMYQHELRLTGHPPGGLDDPDFTSYVTDVHTQKPKSLNPAAYIQDTWRVLPSLTLSLGLRWEQQRFYDSHDDLKLSLDDEWAPRIGFAWDVRNDGKAKLFGSWGRFYETAPLMLSYPLNDISTSVVFNRALHDVKCDPTLAGEPWFAPCGVVSGPREGQRMLDSGKVMAVLDIPPQLTDLAEPHTRLRWLRRYRKKPWVVYSQAPFAGPRKLLDYLKLKDADRYAKLIERLGLRR